MSNAHAIEVWRVYWFMCRKMRLPLLVKMLETAEVTSRDYECILESYLGEAITA